MKLRLRLALGAALSFLLAGCAGSPTFLHPASSVASAEAILFEAIIFLSAGVLLLVGGLLIYNIFRFRHKPGDESEPEQLYGNHPLQLGWTVAPVLLVALLFLFTLLTMQAVAEPSPTRNDLRVEVIGHQWWFEYRYPDLGIVTANELHVPLNRHVELDLRSADVIHSFWVPQLTGKLDVFPDYTNRLWFNADRVGEFYGHCAELCGRNHANMRIKVIVHYPDDFDEWVTNQLTPLPTPQTDVQQRGHDILVNGICHNCHTVGASEALNPTIAPNLTHLMSRSVFAGATYPLNEEYLRAWLENNQELKPGNLMSDIRDLEPDTIDALMAYLLTLR